jgi:hypothetical protein
VNLFWNISLFVGLLKVPFACMVMKFIISNKVNFVSGVNFVPRRSFSIELFDNFIYGRSLLLINVYTL